MSLYPAKSLTKYKIGNKEIIIIGETHLKTAKQEMDVIYTWDFIGQKLMEGYELNLELNPLFKQNIDKALKIHSVNIQETLKKVIELKKMNNTNGVDFRRRSDFFGIFGNDNIQAFFFNKSKELKEVNILQFLAVIDNIMVFTNKHFYDKFKDLIIQMNKPYLDLLFHAHQQTDKHSQFIKGMINHDAKNTKKQLYTFTDTHELLKKTNYPISIDNIVIDIRNFVLLFSDLLTLIEILYHPNPKHILLIGEQHAINLKKNFQQYIIYPDRNITSKKLTNKQIKSLGTEVKLNHVSIRLLK